MSSALRLIASSNVISDAEKMVLAENQRLTADEKKRRLLSFGPTGTNVVYGVPTSGISDTSPTDDAMNAILIGDIHRNDDTNCC